MTYLLILLSMLPLFEGKNIHDTTNVVAPYSVSFYPEGGTLLLNKACRVTFKVTNREGQPEEITGEIVDGKNNKIQTVQTFYKGLGYFDLYPNKGTEYYLRCENSKGEKGDFTLPSAREDRYGVRVHQEEKRILISVDTPDHSQSKDSLYLLVQEGDSIVYGELWNPEHRYLVISKADIKSALSHVLLVDKEGQLLSGRSFFHLEDKTLLQTLPPDMRISLLPILNNPGNTPQYRDQVLDLLAQTLQIEKIETYDSTDSLNDIWKTINLDGVEVRAFKKEKTIKGMYSAAIPSSRMIQQEEIERWHIPDMRSLLSRFSGVEFHIDRITRRYYPVIRQVVSSFASTDEGKPLVVIDNTPLSNFDILDYPVDDVENIFILKGTDAAVFGPKAANGVIVITTKRGKFLNEGFKEVSRRDYGLHDVDRASD